MIYDLIIVVEVYIDLCQFLLLLFWQLVKFIYFLGVN